MIYTFIKNRIERYSLVRLILAGALMVLVILALSAWIYMPIYPDEVAVRLLSGRYIQDHHLSQKLFHICPSNARETPLVFVIPAWILSWIDLHFSIVEMRILPFTTIFATIFISIWFAVKGRNMTAAVVATSALIGVSGSGLIIARAEYLQVLNVACCMWVFIQVQSVSLSSMRYGQSVLLLLSCLLSIYSHVQGLLFLPLTLYLIYCLVYSKLGKIKSLVLLIVLFFIVVKTTIIFKNSSCVEYPGIAQFIKDMVFNLQGFESVDFTDWVAEHIQKYYLSFYFKDSYQVNYLPGINVSQGWLKSSLHGLNQSIHIILMVNLMLFVSAAIAALIFAIKRHIQNYKMQKTGSYATKDLETAYVIILFAFPLIFLFFYDDSQNFYRSFFMNFLVSIMLSMVLSRLCFSKLRILADACFILCGAVVLASLIVNVWWFTDKLRAGFEGPSMSINTDWDGIQRDVMTLSKECGMDLSKGRIIVDDMTYESLKRYPFLYPVTYLKLSGNLTKLTSTEIINRVRPNYAIVRCDRLRSWGLTPQMTRNQLCAVNFLNSEYLK